MNEKFDQVKYKNDYIKQNYDRINLLLPKGMKERLKGVAEVHGDSLNGFICKCIEKYLHKNNL